MQCQKCKAEIVEGAKFCRKCGTPVIQSQDSNPVIQSQHSSLIFYFQSIIATRLIKNSSLIIKSLKSINFKYQYLLSAFCIVLALVIFVSFIQRSNINKIPLYYLKDNRIYVKEINKEKQKISGIIGDETQLSDYAILVDSVLADEFSQKPLYYTGFSAASTKFINTSTDGKYTYYIQGVSDKNATCDLFFKNANSNDSVKIASDVLVPSLVFSSDGHSVLFLKIDNPEIFEEDIDMYDIQKVMDKLTGDLYVSIDGNEAEKIASDVPIFFYIFGNDNKTVAFIQNLYINVNEDQMIGNLYIKKPGQEKKKVDDEANFPIALGQGGKSIIYAKNFGDHGFDLYIKQGNRNPVALFYNVQKICMNKNETRIAALVDYDYEKETGDLYYMQIGRNKVKIDTDVNNVLSNGNTHLYTHPLFSNFVKKFGTSGLNIFYIKEYSNDPDVTKGCELYVSINGYKKQIISDNCNPAHFKVNENGDFFGYLENYDFDKGSGELYIGKIINKKLVNIETVSDNVVDFNISENNDSVAYIANYDSKKSVGNLYWGILGDNQKELVGKNVYGGVYDNYKISKDGSVLSFVDNYDSEKSNGTLYIKYRGKEKVEIASDVYNYFTNDHKIFYYLKNLDNEKGICDLYYWTIDDKNNEKIDNDVSGILSFDN